MSDTVGVLLQTEGRSEAISLVSPAAEPVVYLMNDAGQLLHRWSVDERPGMAADLHTDGTLVRAARIIGPDSPFAGGRGLGGRAEALAFDGTVLWRIDEANERFHQHHDMAIMPSGNVLLLLWERHSGEEAVLAGRDPRLLDEGEIWSETVREYNVQTGEVVWQWRSWDHLVQNRSEQIENYGDPAATPGRIDINRVNRPIADWLHANAIDYNASLDQIMLSIRALSEVWIIDHSTTTAEAATSEGGRSGLGGDLLYRFGNNPGLVGTGERLLFGQHDSHWIDADFPGGGNVLVFDNGQGRPDGEFSRVLELRLPLTEHRRYAGSDPTVVWSWEAPWLASRLSGAVRHANGNTTACAGPLGGAYEVTPAGEVVWHFVNPVVAEGVLTQGEVVTEDSGNRLFRLPRYAPTYQGLTGLDLTAGPKLPELPAP